MNKFCFTLTLEDDPGAPATLEVSRQKAPDRAGLDLEPAANSLAHVDRFTCLGTVIHTALMVSPQPKLLREHSPVVLVIKDESSGRESQVQFTSVHDFMVFADAVAALAREPEVLREAGVACTDGDI